MSAKKNNTRFDLSNWLIHFFRNVDLSSNDAPAVPEHLGWGNIQEDVNWSALFMLRCAIRQCRLWATWSYRGGRRTIYGPAPAVCFTEMPIAAFLEAGQARRARGEAMSPFAIIFPKRKLFNIGARPVIYGLSAKNPSIPKGDGGGPRIINPKKLPLEEQYRYVTFQPSGFVSVDWTHEREWRWPYVGDLAKVNEQLEDVGIVGDAKDMPGLDLFAPELSGLGVVVENAEQASWIAHDILSLVDRSIVSEGHFQFILKSNELKDLDTLRTPKEVTRAISKALVDLSPFFATTCEDAAILESEFKAQIELIDKEHSGDHCGERGGVWLWLLDNTHPLTRALLLTGRIEVTRDGRYLASLPELSKDRDLREREAMVQELAHKITKRFGIECGYFSVLNSHDPNDLPFYADDHLDNRMYYNVSW
jgi:hypothetical protein